MNRKNASKTLSFEYGARQGDEPSDWEEPQQYGNVILWPKEQQKRPGEAASDAQGLEDRSEEILRRLGSAESQLEEHTPLQGSHPLATARGNASGISLQEEIPAAMRAYDSLATGFKDALPYIVSQKKIDAAMFEQSVADIVASLERNRDALLFLTKTLAPKAYIHSHSVNVCVLLAAFALNSGKSRFEAITAGLAGLFHDIGMALLPLSLLNSDRKLSATEQALVKRHPKLGFDLLSSVPDLHTDIVMAALEHHECFDGTGYPAATKGSGISYMGHLTAIASTYDAISSNRLYKASMHPHKALGTMFRLRSKQFHPVLLENFVQMMGIYPVGTVVELSDGYRGVVSACSASSPTRPVVTIVRDPKGRPMLPQKFDMAEESVASIKRCLSANDAGLREKETFDILTKGH